jgi:hypothetical protein
VSFFVNNSTFSALLWLADAPWFKINYLDLAHGSINGSMLFITAYSMVQ